jgi:isoleucyl-tRNA synthetase
VRRSRRRFWKSGDDADKQTAYGTLHYVLAQISLLLAPFTPFLAEELFLKLTGGELGESVHLLDWPEAGHVDELALSRMAEARQAITEGLALRAQEGLKVRQPLASVTLTNPAPALLSELEREETTGERFYHDIICEELNVKAVKWQLEGPGGLNNLEVLLDAHVTPELKREGMMREVIRNVQQARKSAGLQVDDRIVLYLHAEARELAVAIEEHRETILQETLASELTTQQQEQFATVVKVEGHELQVSLSRA